MKTRKIPRGATFALFFGAAALIAVACSSTTGGSTTGSGGSTGTIVGPGPNSSSGSPASSSGGGHPGTGGGTGGCVMGAPMSNSDFLNACNGLTCNPFDNKGRLPLLKPDGTLPALP